MWSDREVLGREDVHAVKDGINAAAKDWTGISPENEVISSDPSGNAVNHGHIDNFL